MTLVVRDNKTNKVLATETNNDMTYMMAVVQYEMRNAYTNATIETYYGNVNGNPVTTIKTFH